MQENIKLLGNFTEITKKLVLQWMLKRVVCTLCKIIQFQISLQYFMRTYFINKIPRMFIHVCMHAYIICCVYVYIHIYVVYIQSPGHCKIQGFLAFPGCLVSYFPPSQALPLFVFPATDPKATCSNPTTNSETRPRVNSLTYWFQ